MEMLSSADRPDGGREESVGRLGRGGGWGDGDHQDGTG